MARLQGFLKKTEGPAPAPAPVAPVKSVRRPATKVAATAAAAAPRTAGAATAPAKNAPAPAETPSDRMMLLTRLRDSEAQDFYQLLEVETGASEDVIQKSYYSLARRYHPDRFHAPDVADLQPAMEMLFARVNEAFYSLKDPERRQKYDRVLYKGNHDTRKVQQAAAEEVGRENYRRGRQLVAMGQYVKALSFLENAVRADESKAEYFETLGMVQSLNPRLKQEAEQTLKKACELAPASGAGPLRLGLHYFKTRQSEKAAKALHEALGWDPTNALARIAMGKVKAGGASAVKDGTWLIRQVLQNQADD
jgi:curved DNA-binding protein CbpA